MNQEGLIIFCVSIFVSCLELTVLLWIWPGREYCIFVCYLVGIFHGAVTQSMLLLINKKTDDYKKN
jgi:hypothetical protein